MATQTDRRIIQLDVTTDPKAQKSIRDINTHLRSLEGSAKKSQRAVTQMSRGFNLLSIAAKAYIALRVAGAVTDTSDAMILLGARINIVTETTVGLEAAMSDLFDIAGLTRQSIQATGTLYARLGFATKALNLEHQDLLDIVQGVNNTLLLSGASAQESASSIIQLSQAFSKGSLDGDEFRSVSEGNVILFGIMQEVLGKTARELRQFSRDGKLSGDLLSQVLTSDQIKALQSRVDEIPFTFAQAFTLIGNELAKLASEFEDEFAAITTFIVDSLNSVVVASKFFKAISDDLIDADVFLFEDMGIENMKKQLKEVQPLIDQLNKESATGAKVYRDELKRLNEQFNVNIGKIESLRRKLAALEDSIFEVFTLPTQEKLGEELRSLLALQNAIPHAIRLQQAAAEQVTAEYEKQQAVLKRAGDLGQAGSVDPSVIKEIDALTLSMRNAEEVYVDYIKNLERLNEAGKGELSLETANRAGAKALDTYLDSLKKVNKATKEAETNSEALGVAIGVTLAAGIGDISDALFDMALGLEVSFRATIESILEDIGRLIVKITLLNALKAGLGSEAGTFGGFLFPSAKGNIFNGGDIVPFASGGVINSPTFFPLSSGIGLAGEAGPEAILPLERGADGKLGVSGAGGPEQVTVNIDNNGSQSQITSSSATTDISGTVVNIVLDDLRRGGPIRDSVKGIGEF